MEEFEKLPALDKEKIVTIFENIRINKISDISKETWNMSDNSVDFVVRIISQEILKIKL